MFSETATGFSASSLSNGSVTRNQVAGSGSGPYTFSVTPISIGFVTVRVTGNTVQDLAGNRNDASNQLCVQYTSSPTLTSLSPQSGPVGTSVTLTGTNLSGATNVSFNGTAATFTVVNATTITTTVLSGATSGPVTVTTPGSTTGGVTFIVVTATPVVAAPTNNSTTSGRPTYAGTAPAGSTVTIYLAAGSEAAQATGTTTATGGSFSLTPTTALASGSYAA